jgi:catechol-2,3-dioxygenase
MTASCRIDRLRYIALGVKDLSAQAEFYRDTWGLTRSDGDGDAHFLSTDACADPFLLRLRSAGEDRLDLVSMSVRTPQDVDAYVDRLRGLDVRFVTMPQSLPSPLGGYGFRFFDRDGRTIEIATDVASVPTMPTRERDWRPGALSHVVLNTPDLEGLTQWYCDVLGFRVSDRLSDVMVFLAGDSPFHHTLALAKNSFASLNHIAFETRGIDEYLRASGRLLRAGLPCVWGPGRHGPGDNTFSYFQDNAGNVVEYTTALQRIDDWTTWKPRVHPVTPEWSDQWGTACPRRPEPFTGLPDMSAFQAPPF